jgi:hypothetical protein
MSMRKKCRAPIPWVIGALTVCIASAGAAAQEAPRPGRLTKLLGDTENHGKAWATQGLAWLFEREAVSHLLFMATDPRGGTGGGGWYRPSQSRYGWQWLRQRYDKHGDGAVSLTEFSGPREWFEALDKTGDGLLRADDFEWFGDSALAKASVKGRPLFSQIDQDGNGQITSQEWMRWFDLLSRRRGYIAQDDLLPLFLDRRAPGFKMAGKQTTLRDHMPIVCSYIAGDVGSLNEGPALDGAAPYFVLPTADGKDKVDLARHKGKKPLVLIFGSFT